MSNSVSGIYQIKHIASGKIYIGSSINIANRWSLHKKQLQNNKHPNRHLQFAWLKYGADAFEFSILETCFFFALIMNEQKWMDELKPEYNIRKIANSNLGMKASDETRAKISLVQNISWTQERREKKSVELMGNTYNLGRKASEETRAKLRGKTRSPETLAKMSASQKARKPRSSETRAKISVSNKFNNKGRYVSFETRKKQSATHVGIKNTPESIAKTIATKMKNAVAKVPFNRQSHLSINHRLDIAKKHHVRSYGHPMPDDMIEAWLERERNRK